ncbi:hypothetical protein HY620_01585 [Candidatus Uhrbacteria bacterium]|nr:hypothetical protein [Candidatus Uhrbacteria bacterium]
MNTLCRIVFLVIFSGFFLQPLAIVQAQMFNQNSILSDADFFRANDMSASDIQFFLERKRSALATYTAQDIDGKVKFASEIIWRAATANGINPKVLLVLLQKEQSLIENSVPTQYSFDWATGFGICDDCSPSDPRLQDFKGFVSQVNRAATRKKLYTTNPFDFSFRKGETRLVDGEPILPATAATAALYNYTPHIRGNYSFWKLWQRYFGKQYPDGTIVQVDGKQEIWIIVNGKRRIFSTMGSFLSRYSRAQIVTISEGDLESYPQGSPIRFPQYSLLQSANGAVFLYADDKKYGIPSREIFRKIGFNPAEIIRTPTADLDAIPTAGMLSAPDKNPAGELVQRKNGGIYYLVGGRRHPVLERSVLQTNFAYRKIKPLSDKDLEQTPVSEPVLFADGTLVSQPGSPTVYVISNAEKRPFVSGDVFLSLGYQWSQIAHSNGRTLDHHPLGSPVDLGKEIQDTEATFASREQ